MATFDNPFRPGAGLPPPHLAGRAAEVEELRTLLARKGSGTNGLITGLRGVGKTVLLDSKVKQAAKELGWLWVGSELNEAASKTEEALARRLVTDLAVATSTRRLAPKPALGFEGRTKPTGTVDHDFLWRVFQGTPGLATDKLKAVLRLAWEAVRGTGARGIVFAYDEAQTLCNHEKKEEYPLSLLLDVFQSVEKAGLPVMLVLAGLPTLLPRLVEARTFAERMFSVVGLGRLDDEESREAILVPIKEAQCSAGFTGESVDLIIKQASGYPYFLQFICREAFDAFIDYEDAEGAEAGPASIPLSAIVAKLDADFFAGRWNTLTDRQRDLLTAVSFLGSSDREFTVRDIVDKSRERLDSGFSSSHASGMLSTLIDKGMVYRNRHGKYSLAVPLLAEFIRRQRQDSSVAEASLPWSPDDPWSSFTFSAGDRSDELPDGE